MTPIQKAFLAKKMAELKNAQGMWYLEQIKRLKLDKSGDANWTKYVTKSRAKLRKYMKWEERLSYAQYKRDILNNN